MKSVRYGTFETNSSSCHCVTVISKQELENFARNRWYDCIYLPDTGDYCTGSEYRIMSKDDARLQYNKDHSYVDKEGKVAFYEKVYQDTDGVHKNDDDWQDDFEDDLDRMYLDDDKGRYMTFEQLMACAAIEGDIKFDISWWNND